MVRIDRDERISVDQFLGMCEGMDTSRVELIDGTLWISGRLFYDFVKDYLALIGEEPRISSPMK